MCMKTLPVNTWGHSINAWSWCHLHGVISSKKKLFWLFDEGKREGEEEEFKMLEESFTERKFYILHSLLLFCRRYCSVSRRIHPIRHVLTARPRIRFGG